MPNDMSPQPTVDCPRSEALAQRARLYCRRAKALSEAPDLTVGEAANALGHLAALEGEIAAERARQSAGLNDDLGLAQQRYCRHEAALRSARTDLSAALLRARPDPGDDTPRYGHVAHGPRPDSECSETKSAPVQSISACRALLDLDALRPYLSDEALRSALARHIKATGRHDVRGVAYAALPPGAHLPCDIT